MNRKLLLLYGSMFCTAPGFAQRNLSPEIISPAGGINLTSSGTLEWTLGELAVATVNTPASMYTQGYNQPLLSQRLNGVSMAAPQSAQYNIAVFPNPATSQLTIHVDSKIDSKLSIQLLDMNGKLLFNEISGSMNEDNILDLTKYTAGLYLLRISDSAGIPIEAFKISKVY